MTVKRVGVLTGGGDCPGLNAVIRAVVKTAAVDFDLEVIGIEDGYEGLVERRSRPLSFNAVSGILAEGGTILGTSNRANPFGYPAPGSDEFVDRSADVADYVGELGLDCLVCIGGDGTLTIAHRLMRECGIPCVGVPKTIDNDLYGTDVTFGFDTARQIATEAIDRLHTTAQSHHRVMVIEVMGRNAGWLALESGVAGGGDVILIPEIPFDVERVLDVVVSRSRKGRRFSIVVVSEGVKPDGAQVVRSIVQDSMSAVRLGGVGQVLTDRIQDATGVETRVTVLGHLQRGGTPTSADRILATRFGREAIAAAAAGRHGVMIGISAGNIVEVPLDDIAGRQRLVPPDHHLITCARSVGTSFGN